MRKESWIVFLRSRPHYFFIIYIFLIFFLFFKIKKSWILVLRSLPHSRQTLQSTLRTDLLWGCSRYIMIRYIGNLLNVYFDWQSLAKVFDPRVWWLSGWAGLDDAGFKHQIKKSILIDLIWNSLLLTVSEWRQRQSKSKNKCEQMKVKYKYKNKYEDNKYRYKYKRNYKYKCKYE